LQAAREKMRTDGELRSPGDNMARWPGSSGPGDEEKATGD